jgi:cytoskeleton protein RodZ
MASVGTYLQELRARRGVSLEEISRTTRVAPRYLLALENDAFSELPAPVFIRGFIRAYCQALGESAQEALAIYDGHEGRPLPPPLRASTPTRARATDARPRGALVVSFVLLVVLGMALFTVALVIRPGDRVDRPGVEALPEPRPAPQPEASSDGEPATPTQGTAPAPANDSPPSPATARSTPPTPVTATPSTPVTPTPPAPVRPTPTAPAAPVPSVGPPKPEATSAPRTAAVQVPPAPTPSLEVALGPVSSPYRLVARTNETTWIRVRMEDGRSSEETVPAGEIREWVSDRPFVLTVGNAGGVSFELNGRALPPLGASGVVIPRLVLPPDAR